MILNYCKARNLFRSFLKTINLDRYREEFKDKKYVEQDLPDDVVTTILESLYENYWVKRRFISFDDWFEEVWNKVIYLKGFIEDFLWYYWHMNLGKDKDWDKWFKEGFKARLYRIWTAVLTQFDFAYTMACVIEEGRYNIPLSASPELNKKGVDVRLNIQEGFRDLQVYKISERKEARGKTRGRLISVPYPVISRRELIKKIESPHTRKKEAFKIMLSFFDMYYEELDNGFIVFKKELAKEILERILLDQDIGEFIERLVRALRGEQ